MNKKNIRRILIVVGILAIAGLLYVGFPKQRAALFGAASPSDEAVRHSARGAISPYDRMMRQVGEEEGIDWLLLAAVAHAESKFKPDATSRKGAKGLMQIMPSVARQFDVAWEEMDQPLANIRVGAKLLNDIGMKFRFPDQAPKEDRLRIILAAYNAGTNHVLELRKRLAGQGINFNSWNVLEGYVPDETAGFVQKVMRQYRRYREKYA